MILKMTNRDEDFYKYMGRFFGSRIVERQTNDRIYDDPNKLWYIYINDEKPVAFVSMEKNAIKNIYTIKDKYLEELLEEIMCENKISSSIVTNLYLEIYHKCGFEFLDTNNYKNFVIIYTSEIKKRKSDKIQKIDDSESAEQNSRLALV